MPSVKRRLPTAIVKLMIAGICPLIEKVESPARHGHLCERAFTLNAPTIMSPREPGAAWYFHFMPANNIGGMATGSSE